SFIPIPVIGTLIGELLGEYVGDLFYTGLMGGGMDAVGKKMQEDITSLLKAGKFVADWIGDGFGRLNEGIPSFMGVKNYLVILNPVESVPLFYKAFFTRDSMTEKEEKEPDVEQKFLGGVVNAAKDFLGMSSTESGGLSTTGLAKEPKKLPGISLTKIPLKGDETYIGVRFKNNALSKGLGSIFGGNTGLGSIFGGNTGNNGGGIIRSDGPPSLGSTDVQANIQAILKAAKDMNYTGDILALLAIAKGESGIKGIPEQPITDAGRASQIWSISRAEAQQLLDSGGWRALYNEVYGWSGNSLGNRPGTNDGSDFIGRGFIQITGRHNYKDIGNRIGVDFMSNPELLLDKDIAAKATIAFMQRGGSPRDMESALRAVGGIKEGWPKKRGFYEDFKQLASDGKLKINSAQIASKDSSGANIEPVTPRKPTPDNNDKSTSKDKLPGSGDESSDSILLDPSKPPSIQNIIHPDLMAGGTFGGGFNMAGGVTRSDSKGEVSKPSMMKIGSGSGPKIARSPDIAPAQNASFGSVNIKNYQIQESAHYDEPGAQIIIMPPPQQNSQPQRKLASNTGKSNGVPPLFPLNKDINDIVSQAAFY
ncbi:MAG: glycoside hydrolase family 19 protein, partial [Candidatus Neomarinimicrobiota bacterium]